jgi:hypothetical protein
VVPERGRDGDRQRENDHHPRHNDRDERASQPSADQQVRTEDDDATDHREQDRPRMPEHLPRNLRLDHRDRTESENDHHSREQVEAGDAPTWCHGCQCGRAGGDRRDIAPAVTLR